MSVAVRPVRAGDGEGLARIWLENARYYTALFPEDFRMPKESGLAEWFEKTIAHDRADSEITLVATVGDDVAAFVYARLSVPDEDAERQMLEPYVHARAQIEALGTGDRYQRSGLATQLVEAVEAWARERGARSISATTHHESPVSVPFWRGRMGYAQRGITVVKVL